MNPDAFVTLLQFSDGLFPVGSYAHSFGLESYAATGAIRDGAGVYSFLLAYLEGCVAPVEAVVMLSSRRAARNERLTAAKRCLEIDQRLDAMKLASESRAASRQMGRQVWRIANGVGEPFASHGLAADLLRAVESEETPGHHAVAFGAVGAILAWHELDMARAYLYSTCAGLVAASLRLLSLGQLAGQRILWDLGPAIGRLAEQVRGRDLDDVWSFAPALEIAAMRHETLDARLFRS